MVLTKESRRPDISPSTGDSEPLFTRSQLERLIKPLTSPLLPEKPVSILVEDYLSYLSHMHVHESSFYHTKLWEIQLLEGLFTLTKQREVKAFLLNHDYLIEVLREAYRQIRQTFGKAVELYLELHHDPEEDFEELFVIVKGIYNPEEALNLLDNLDNRWFLDVLDKTEGNLNITVEIV